MIHRARYGFGDGPHAITFNFFRQLKSEIERHKADIVYMVDEGRPTQSLAVDANYKGNRVHDKDDSFHRQKREIFQLAKTAAGIKYAQHPEFECDDVIAHLATEIHKDDDVTIVSSDTDFIQLLENHDNIHLWSPVKKIFVERIPNYLVRKSLTGDATDNVPGIPGVGLVTANKLAADSVQCDAYLDKHEGSREIFDRAYKMIKFKPVQNEEVRYIESRFDEQKLLEEFTNRDFKSIIGNAWPKWIKTFGGING